MTRDARTLDPVHRATPRSDAPTLRRAIGLPQAVALYVSSVLGSGILVLPGLAARIAGPASLIAWVLLAAAGVPFALTFASLSVRRPRAGGIYEFAKEAFGPRVALVTGWLFGFWVMTGAPAVALVAASYVGYAFPLTRPEAFVVGFGVVLAAFLVNLRGIVLSTTVQVAVIGSIVALLGTVIVLSTPRVDPSAFRPFFPDGLVPVGTAAALIFWSYLGYENVSNVAEEFTDPERDFRRSALLSVTIVGALYVAVAFVTVGTRAYEVGGGVAPFGVILGNVVGPYGAAATAVLTVFIVFGVTNAYVAGMSRVAFATARDGGYPRTMAHVDPVTLVPDRALLALLAVAIAVFVIYFAANVDLTQALLVTSGTAIAVYVIGCAAGVRIYAHSVPRSVSKMALALIALLIALIVLPFVGGYLLATAAVAAVGFGYATWRARRPPRSEPTI
ncbi:MAG: APC family permease [Thermoplasmata archaeon]